MTSLSAHTLAIYRAAVYRIDGEPHIDMKIGAINHDVAALMKHHAVKTAVFVTAFNPFGAICDASINEARQRKLGAVLDSMKLRTLPGIGFDPNEAPPHAEASFFVLGADERVADTLLLDFEQNAVVIVDEDATPQLLLHPQFR